MIRDTGQLQAICLQTAWVISKNVPNEQLTSATKVKRILGVLEEKIKGILMPSWKSSRNCLFNFPGNFDYFTTSMK